MSHFVTQQSAYNIIVCTTENPIIVAFQSSNQRTISIMKYHASISKNKTKKNIEKKHIRIVKDDKKIRKKKMARWQILFSYLLCYTCYFQLRKGRNKPVKTMRKRKS